MIQSRSERLGLEPGSILARFEQEDAQAQPDKAFCGQLTDARSEEVAHSIAISLKRIADAIVGDERNTGIHQAILEVADRGGHDR